MSLYENLKTKFGGDPVASGTYGCVFNPALECKGQQKTITDKQPMISKLMYKKWANLEYDEITQFAKIIQTIPHYKNYFLVDNISICSPKLFFNDP